MTSKNHETPKQSIKALGTFKRKAVTVSRDSLIVTEYLHLGSRLPLVIKPAIEDLTLVGWASHNKEFIETQLAQHGGILFRNFKLNAEAEFEPFTKAIAGDLLEYTYGSTPRSQVVGKIYTSTEYPADETIPLHNEMSYTTRWPLKIWFFCVKEADEGGETPIADSRKVFEQIDPKIREQFIQKGVMYVRNYRSGLDLPWEKVFQTTHRSEVERYCREAGLEMEWLEDGQLRTRQVCQAAARHPKTGEMVWFNQAHLFHVSNLRSDLRDSMLSAFREENLPRNAYFGDGSTIEPEMLDEIREAYRLQSVVFRWQQGDILMLDNMLTAHGRMPFSGQRRILVGMAEPYSAATSSG